MKNSLETDGVFSEKERLRKEFFHKRLLLSKDEVESLSKEIIENIRQSHFLDNCVFLFYVPIRNEVDLLPLARELFYCKGKTVLFPKIFNYERLIPCVVRDFDFDFKRGAFGIPEPDTEQYNSKIDLVFVPGIVFGRNGYRIGYGKRFYDEFLASFPVDIKVGVCYDFQLIESVPYTKKDCRLDFIVTEKGIYEIHQER